MSSEYVILKRENLETLLVDSFKALEFVARVGNTGPQFREYAHEVAERLYAQLEEVKA